MPKWMHDRAEHILAKNPSMPKGEAFAIATQQSHALGKSPKGYGTAEGKHTAKAKFDTPKDDVKAANPGGLTSPKMEKKSMSTEEMSERMKTAFSKIAKPTTSETETKGSLETNVADTVKGTNHVSLGAGEQKGVPAEGYLWGQDPPAGKPLVGKRSPTHETMSTGAEEVNKEDNWELLRRAFANMTPASETAKSIIEQNFDHGRRGTYVTHAQTLLEQVRGVTGRA